jgi:hypothetical protein
VHSTVTIPVPSVFLFRTPSSELYSWVRTLKRSHEKIHFELFETVDARIKFKELQLLDKSTGKNA